MRVIEPKWVTAASKLCRRKWNSLSTANNLGVVKKDGFKKGRKDEEDVDWNRDLMQIKCVEQTLESKYEALHKDILQNHEDLSTKCRKMIDSTRAKISGQSGQHGSTMPLANLRRRPAVQRDGSSTILGCIQDGETYHGQEARQRTQRLAKRCHVSLAFRWKKVAY